jgi:hypothetical protein
MPELSLEDALRAWAYWKDGCGELLPYCPECATREFARDASASGRLPLVHREWPSCARPTSPALTARRGQEHARPVDCGEEGSL